MILKPGAATTETRASGLLDGTEYINGTPGDTHVIGAFSAELPLDPVSQPTIFIDFANGPEGGSDDFMVRTNLQTCS